MKERENNSRKFSTTDTVPATLQVLFVLLSLKILKIAISPLSNIKKKVNLV